MMMDETGVNQVARQRMRGKEIGTEVKGMSGGRGVRPGCSNNESGQRRETKISPEADAKRACSRGQKLLEQGTTVRSNLQKFIPSQTRSPSWHGTLTARLALVPVVFPEHPCERTNAAIKNQQT